MLLYCAAGAKYDAKLSQLEFDNERKVIAAVALETSKIDSLIQIALDRAEIKHRQDIKAATAA